jgi:two-component system response regulator BaeR
MLAAAPRRVLVVEDDAKIAQLLLDYLRSEGFEASAVADGQLALRQIEDAPPSVIVLDLMLPGLDGISVCKAVRRFSEVPILMLTARIEVMEVGLQAIALHEEALSKRMLAGVQQVCCKLPVV